MAIQRPLYFRQHVKENFSLNTFHCFNQHYALKEIPLFSIWAFFHEHSRFTGQQGKGEAISLTSFYHFLLLYRHLDISRDNTAQLNREPLVSKHKSLTMNKNLPKSLTYQMPVLLSYRNQSIDLHSKSIGWFLYEGNTGI